MLKFFRNSSKTWFARIFFAVFAAAILIVWGAGDGLKFSAGGHDNQILMKIGSEKISAFRFLNDLNKESKLIKARSGKTPDMTQLKAELLNRLMTSTLLDLEVDKMGITTCDEEVKGLIRNTFVDESGTFNKAIFEANLNAMQLNETQFTQNLKRELAREKLVQTIAHASFAPDTIVLPMFNWQYEKRVIEPINIDYKKFDVANEITEKDLQDNYDKNPKAYTTPEKRDISLILISQDDLEKGLTLTPEERAAGFAAKSDQIAGTAPTEAETNKIIAEIKADKAIELFNKTIQKLDDDLAGGAKLEDAAKENNLPLIRIINLDNKGNSENPDPKIASFLQQIGNDAFSLQLNDEIPIKEIDNKTRIAIKVDKITTKNLRALQDVKDDVKKAVTIEKQFLKAAEAAKSIKTKINAGSTIAEATKGFPVTISKQLTISKNDKTDGMDFNVLGAGFTAEKNKSEIAEIPEGFAVVVATKIIPVEESAKKEHYSNFKQNVRHSIANDMIMQYISALRKKYTVDLNEGLFKQINLEQ